METRNGNDVVLRRRNAPRYFLWIVDEYLRSSAWWVKWFTRAMIMALINKLNFYEVIMQKYVKC